MLTALADESNPLSSIVPTHVLFWNLVFVGLNSFRMFTKPNRNGLHHTFLYLTKFMTFRYLSSPIATGTWHVQTWWNQKSSAIVEVLTGKAILSQPEIFINRSYNEINIWICIWWPLGSTSRAQTLRPDEFCNVEVKCLIFQEKIR